MSRGAPLSAGIKEKNPDRQIEKSPWPVRVQGSASAGRNGSGGSDRRG